MTSPCCSGRPGPRNSREEIQYNWRDPRLSRQRQALCVGSGGVTPDDFRRAQEERAQQCKMHHLRAQILFPLEALRHVEDVAHVLAEADKMKLNTGVRCAALLAVMIFGNLPSHAFAQTSSCPGIHVTTLNIRNSTGSLDCAIFDSTVGFPTKVLHSATQVMITKILKKEARFTFEDLPPGTYALVAFHDENMNGKFDTNWLGIPKEGINSGDRGTVWESAFNR
jgi:uncharacterized protein (DUF2141 family)